MLELVILLPAKNEEEGLGEVIDRIPKKAIEEMGYEPRVVVVDGNSTDSTCDIALEKGAELIHQRSSAGKGSGVREALAAIYGSTVDESGGLLVMMDADATYSPEDLPRFIEELQNYEVVWGSRLRGKIEKHAMSKTNLLGNRLLSLAASVVFLKKTSDLCTGYWGFRSYAITKLPLSADGFNLEADLFGSVVKSGNKCKEIPIDYSHREGQSSLKWYRDGPRILMMILRNRFKVW